MLSIVTGKLESQQNNQEGRRQSLGLDGPWDCDLKGLNGSRRLLRLLWRGPKPIDCRASDLEKSKCCCSRGLRLR